MPAFWGPEAAYAIGCLQDFWGDLCVCGFTTRIVLGAPGAPFTSSSLSLHKSCLLAHLACPLPPTQWQWVVAPCHCLPAFPPCGQWAAAAVHSSDSPLAHFARLAAAMPSHLHTYSLTHCSPTWWAVADGGGQRGVEGHFRAPLQDLHPRKLPVSPL